MTAAEIRAILLSWRNQATTDAQVDEWCAVLAGEPTAAPATWPYPHRTVAEVDAAGEVG